MPAQELSWAQAWREASRGTEPRKNAAQTREMRTPGSGGGAGEALKFRAGGGLAGQQDRRLSRGPNHQLQVAMLQPHLRTIPGRRGQTLGC